MTTWRIHPATITAPYECTLTGITRRCHGACCYNRGMWPPSAGDTPLGGACVHLGPTGCTLGDARPVRCHLYPLEPNEHGTLVMNGYTRWPQGLCKGNRGAVGAPWLVDALRPGLVAVFGEDVWAHIRQCGEARVTAYFDVPPAVEAALVNERTWMQANVPPLPRGAP